MISDWRKKWAPNGQRMMILLIGLLVFDLMVLAYLTRKPLCLESVHFKYLEWIPQQGPRAQIYNCQRKIPVPLTEVFIEKLESIQKRIFQADGSVKLSPHPFQPVELKIYEASPPLLKISSETIEISESLFFDSPLQLEKAYLKAWLQQLQKGKSLGFLRLEILVQFFLRNLSLERKNQEQWQKILSLWPQLATTWSGYCQSPIKDPSYDLVCVNASLNRKESNLTPFSTHFWLAQKLWLAYQQLSVGQQIDFFKKVDLIVQSLSETEEAPLAEMTLPDLDVFVRKESQIWKEALHKVGMSEWGEIFNNLVLSDLDSVREFLARTDLLVEKLGPWASEELSALQALSLNEPQLRIIGKNEERFWSFPWLSPVKNEAFPQLKVQNLVLLGCEWPTLESLVQRSEGADRVILVKSCEEASPRIIYSGFLRRGLQFFSLDNADLSFVVVNIKALEFLLTREPDLKGHRLVVRSQTSEAQNQLAQKASWTSALWNQSYRAYEVHATIDAVEWFKLPEDQWPDFSP